MLSNPRLGSIALFVVLAGCAEPEVDPEEVGVWANAGSALGVYTHLHTPVAFAIGEHSFVDPTCPITTDDGTTLTVTGGCTDSEQQRFEGTFTITRVDPIDAPRDLDLSFSEYGSGEGDIALLSGTAMVRTLDDALYSYDVELVHAGLATVEIDYAGTVAGDYGAATLWNGSGTVTRSGFSPTGTAEVSTVDQLVDDAICSGQSASGETTIEVDQHVMVVTYDGETDCDEDQAARWSLDGEPQGLVEGITCAVVSDAGPAGAMFWLLALLGLRRRPRPAKSTSTLSPSDRKGADFDVSRTASLGRYTEPRRIFARPALHADVEACSTSRPCSHVDDGVYANGRSTVDPRLARSGPTK